MVSGYSRIKAMLQCQSDVASLEVPANHDRPKEKVEVIDVHPQQSRIPLIFELDDEYYSAFPKSTKALVVVLASASAVMSPLAINIYMPAVPSISKDLNIDNGQTLLSVTMYMVLQGLSPSFWAPISDTYGRRPVLLVMFVLAVAANLGLAYTKVYWLLLVLRMLQATGASPAIPIGAGSIGDVSRRKERGSYMGYLQIGILMGPAVGPIIGGLLTQRWNWHSIFYFLAVLTGIHLILLMLLLPESLRTLVGDGSLRPRGIWLPPVSIPFQHVKQNSEEDPSKKRQWMNPPPKLSLRVVGFDRPWKMFMQADIALMIASYSLPFGVYTMVSSSLSPTLSKQYNYNSIQCGLCFLPLGIGCAVGSLLSGKLLDYDYARAHEKQGENMNLHRARLQHAQLFNALFTATTIANGWCLERTVHIAAPVVFMFFLSLFNVLFFNSMYVDRN